ncbi:xyloglucan endotransglucosylase/hydrolase protein 3-like [Primulina huaijiensis]|uniref:xyloglucan endotransglucosylase/hydrolase protein 3-like n=1 Tax=Primulina huaijiensis TaxID=1492673 RepID=UPI003CC76015
MGYFMNISRSNIPVLSAILFILSLFNPLAISIDDTVKFDLNYSPTWGSNHVTVLGNGTQVQLLLDQQSGAGFNSKKNYGSGIFRLKMKMPNKKDAGVITTFYLTGVPIGQPNGGSHDEVDIEFLGSNGKPFILSTNVFANDGGNREQQFALWFDPKEDFHVYEILWNHHHIVFFVDKIPIRVYHNLKARLGVNYPSHPMHVETSIWNFTSWLGPVDWSQAPFVAEYRGFGVEACVHDSSDPRGCHSPKYYWNAPKYWKLSPIQQNFLKEHVRKNHMVYDYCADKNKHFIECET